MPQKTMEIAHDYYIAIFKTTRAQRYRILNAASTNTEVGPAVSGETYYPHLRGSNNVDHIDWPTTRFAVKEGSIVDTFRARCGNRFWIDLPTSAQWEKAARGGTSTIWYNGGTVETSYADCTNLVVQIGRTRLEEGVTQYSLVTVGSYLGNPYGLYDLIGSRPEYVLDRFKDGNTAAAETVDPVGPTDGTRRALRGQHCQDNHGLRYYAISAIQVENVDNLAANNYESFRFTGDDNCWEVTGASSNYSLNAVTFADADANALAGLKELKVTFDIKPRKGRYELSNALGLTAETVGDVALTVTDAAGNDYADIISLTVEDGKLRLANPNAVRTMIIIR